MDIQEKNNLIEYLAQYLTPQRKEKIEQIVGNRTRHVTLILEDLFQEQNASAIVRTAECYGLQDIHAVEKQYRFRVVDGISMGASKWASLIPYADIVDCFTHMKKQGYTIVAATPHTDSYLLSDVPITDKTALVFGAERYGLSEYVLQHADSFFKIPMYGFTESFNVSVSVAISLSNIIPRLHASSVNWHLSSQEIIDIRLDWYRRSIRAAHQLERKFFLDQTEMV